MKLADIYADQFGLSYELFPPKTAQSEQLLWENLHQLLAFRPSFVTCTYGAGGSTRSKTLDVVTEVKRRYGVPVATHLTCVGSTVDQLREYLVETRRRGIDFIVALRGDAPRGETSFRPVEGGLCFANELVSLIRGEFPDFGIAVAGYPEKHQEAPSLDVDLENLRRKVDAGADIVITQLFYDNADFFRFRDRCQRLGLRVPIVPGILPVTNLSQIQRITSLCGAQMPPDFLARLSERDDGQWQSAVGIDFAVRQVDELMRAGIPGIHFYVLNKSQATCEVLRTLGRTAVVPPVGTTEVEDYYQ